MSTLCPFTITASDVERKAVYATQGGKADLLRVCEQTTTSTPQAKQSFLLLNTVKPKDHKKALGLHPVTPLYHQTGFVLLEKFFNSQCQASQSILSSNSLFIVTEVNFIAVVMKSDLRRGYLT